MKTKSAILAFVAAIALLPSSLNAASGTWTNRTSSIWSATTNWSAATVADGADSTANFSTLAALTNITVTLDSARTLGNLKFGVLTTNTYLVGASTLTLSTSSGQPTVTVTNQTATLGVPLASSQQVLINGQSSVVVTNAVNSFPAGLLLQCGQFGFTSQGAVGSGTIQIGNGPGGNSAPAFQCGINSISTASAGTAPITLSNNFIIRSTRWIFGQNALGQNAQPLIINGNVTLDQGTNANPDFAFNTGSSMTVNGVVSTAAGAPIGNGIRFNALGGGTLALDNTANTFQGNINFVTANTLGIVADGSLGYLYNQLVFTAGGTLRADAPGIIISANRGLITMGATVTFNCQTNNLEIDPYIVGAGGLIKNGTGTLLITSSFNTFTGPVTVNAGTLDLKGNLAAGVSSVTLNNTGLTNASKFLLDTGSSASPNLSVTVNNGCTFDATPVSGYEFVAGKTLSIPAGGFVKATGGTITLDSGATLIGGSGTTSITNAAIDGSVIASSGSTLIPGTQGTAGTISITNNLTLNGQTLQFDLRNNTTEGSGTNDEIIVGGNLTLTGGEIIALNYLDGQLAAGTYKIVKFGGTLTGSFGLAANYPNVTIDNGVGTPGYVTLVVSAPSIASTLFWKGDGTGNVWDINSTANWVTSFANPAVNYIDPDKVIFDNNGSNNVAIDLTVPVYPNAVTFSNTTAKSYTISGSGKITGPEGVTVAANGTNTFLTDNDYAGGTTFLTNGVIQLGNGGATGAAGSGTVTMGTNSPSLVVNHNNPITLPRLTGSGGLPLVVQNGSGTTTLGGAGDNSYLGAVVNSGILALAKASDGSTHALGGTTTVNTGGTLQLGGTGGDQIYNNVTVTLAGGTLDMGGVNEQVANLAGYGSVINGGTLTVGTTILLTNAGTLGVTNSTIAFPAANAAWLNNAGSVVFEGGSLTLPTTAFIGAGTAGTQNILLDGTVTTGGNGETIFGERNCPEVVTFGPNANATFWFLSYNTTVGAGATFWYNGGTVTCQHFNYRGNNTGTTANHYFNGSTIQARVSIADFMGVKTGPLVNFFVSTNGLLLNDQGFNLTILAPLQHDPALGVALDGGLTKSGSGTLTLAATNTFNGSVNVNAGTLIFNNAGSYNNVVVGDNAISQINIVQVGSSLTNNSLTVGTTGGGTETLNFNLGTLGLPTVPVLQVKNVVTNSGPVVVNLIAPLLTPGTVPLIKYGTMNAANFASTWSIAAFPYVNLTLTNDTVNKLISVIVNPGVTPKWKGNLSSAWDTTTLNWTSNGVAAAYAETTPPGQPVTFDNTAVNFTVDISTATVNPAFISMTNNTAYKVTGTLGIGGTGALIKNGSGSLTLSNESSANTYSGITLYGGGSLVAAVPNVLSPNSAMTFNNSTLDVGTNNQTITSSTFNNSSLLGTGTLTGGTGATLTFNNTTNFIIGMPLAGAFSIVQNGPGEMTLTNADTFTASVTVAGGTLRVRNGAALGTGGFTGSTATGIQPGARVILDGSFTTPEGFNLNGAGPDGAGCLVVTNGDVVANGSPTTFGTSATIYVSAGASILFQGGGGNLATLAAGALTKSGPGTLEVGGVAGNSFQATPTVNQGNLVINNCNSGGLITINSGGGLAAAGASLTGGINVAAGGTITPDINNTIGTLTSTTGLTNAGAITLQILKTATATNADQINATGYFVNTGTLTVITNIGTTLPFAAGDTFKLFTLTNYAALTGLTPTLPALPTGLGWTNKLSLNGTIAVVATVSTTPFSIGTTVSGNQLTLTWPADHTGWRLQVQTNSLSTGLNTNWSDVAGSTLVNSVTNAIDAANGSVFYRMVYP